MPYTMRDAPVKGVLPKAALRIWVSTFNSVYDDTGGDEDAARQAAWSNVKKAGYRRGEDGKWTKAQAEIEDIASLFSNIRLIELDKASAMALPVATPTKVYAEFKLLSFGEPNKNKDGFLAEDVTAEVVATLEGSPIYLDEDADDHPAKESRATDRAPYQVGTVTQAEKRDDGVYCIGALQREFLEDRGIDPSEMDKHFSTSMETIFDRARSRYRTGDRLLAYRDALAEGIASPLGRPDDRAQYDVRYMVPLEFHAAALLKRGRNADPNADVLRVAAAEEGEMDEILWSAADVEDFLAYSVAHPADNVAEAAELTSKERKKLRKDQFAYVDDEGEGHLPIHDEAHVRNALNRLNQTDIPVSAKRKALKKILAAAKHMGVKVNLKSDVMKLYGADDSLEDSLRAVQQAFYDKFSHPDPQPSYYPYILHTHEDYVIAQMGDKTYKVTYKRSDDKVEFGDLVEVEIRYEPIKEAGSMAEGDLKTDKTLDGTEEFEKAVELKVKEVAAKMLEDERPKIAERAVAEYVAREKLVAGRLAELGEITPIADEEKTALEEQIRKADDAGYYKIVAERSKAALAKAREERAQASDTSLPPLTIRGDGGALKRDPYDVTVR